MRWSNNSRPIISGNALPGTPTVVRLQFGGVVPDAGPDVVSFAPPPFDVLSDTAKSIPAPAFTDFPLHL